MIDNNVMSRARDFYAIYMASCGGLNYEGKPCPQWSDLNDAVRGHWYVVALRSLQLQMTDPEIAQLGQESKILPSEYVLTPLVSSLPLAARDTRVELAVATWVNYSVGGAVIQIATRGGTGGARG